MPTGYTAGIENGDITTLEEYVWTCARAFGALIHMRDSSLGEKISYPPEDTFYQKTLGEAEQAKSDFFGLSRERQREEYDKYVQEEKADFDRRSARYTEKVSKYVQMRGKVNDWVPPTEEHRGLKTFMLEQISISWPLEPAPFEVLSFAAWHNAKTDQFDSTIVRSKEGAKKDAQCSTDKRDWISQLEASVPIPERMK